MVARRRAWSLRGLALAGALSLVAVACGDSGGSSAESSDSTAPSGSAAPSSTATPQRGGTATFAEFSAAGGLDPTKMGNSGTTGGNTGMAIYDTLMRYNPDTRKYEGRTAQSLEPNADFTVWTLKIKPNIKFNDGTAYDADAVKFVIDRETKEGTAGPKTQLQQFVGSMTVVDPLTLTFKLKVGWAGFPSVLAGVPGMIYSPTQFNKVGDPVKFNLDPGPANAGPFNLKSYKPGEALELVRNPNYYGGDVYLDGLTFILPASPTASLEALKAGSVQSALLIDAGLIKKATDAGFKKNMAVATPGNVIAMNAGDVTCKGGQPAVCAGKADGEVAKIKTATADIRVRRAVAAAVDPKVINDRAYNGAAKPDSAFFGGSPWDPKVPGPKFDPETAKKLVAEAKADGWDGHIRVLAANTPEGQAWAQAVAAQLGVVGMTPDVDTTKPTAQIVSQVQLQRDYDLATFAYAVIDDADSAYPSLVAAFSTEFRRYGYGTAEMDAAIDAMRTANDDPSRVAAFKKFTEIFNRDVPGHIITSLEYGEVYSPKLHGLQRTGNTEFHFDKVWLEK